jgi:hypothetical protein
MKTYILLLIALTFFTVNVRAQQTVKVFNAKLNAKDINHQNSFFHPNFPTTSKIVDPGQLSDNVDYWVGKIFTKGNLRQNSTFLDLGNEESYYLLLDSIDMDYYSSYSLRNVLDKQFGKDPNYLAFRKAFKDAKGSEEKKKLLTDNLEYSDYFSALIKSKLDNIEPSTFTNSTEVEKQIKFGFKASLDTIFLSQFLAGNAKLKAELNSLIDKEISVTGKFHLVGYRKEYLSKVITYFKQRYEPNIEKIRALPNKDQFTLTLLKYFDEKNTGLFAGSALLSIEVEYNVSKISKSGIEAIIKANAQIPNVQIAKVTADILAAFSIDKTFTGEAKTEKIFCVSYAYDAEIETFGNH